LAEAEDEMNDMFDVIEVEIAAPHRVRVISTGKNQKNADAVVAMAVMRRGVEHSFFITAPAGQYAEQIAAMERTFDLRWKADQRAIKRWQSEGPNRDLTWPDDADMVVWLLDKCAGFAARIVDLTGPKLDALKAASLALADEADAEVAALEATIAAQAERITALEATLQVYATGKPNP